MEIRSNGASSSLIEPKNCCWMFHEGKEMQDFQRQDQKVNPLAG